MDKATDKVDVACLIVTALLLDLALAFTLLRAFFLSAMILPVLNTPLA